MREHQRETVPLKRASTCKLQEGSCGEQNGDGGGNRSVSKSSFFFLVLGGGFFLQLIMVFVVEITPLALVHVVYIATNARGQHKHRGDHAESLGSPLQPRCSVKRVNKQNRWFRSNCVDDVEAVTV